MKNFNVRREVLEKLIDNYASMYHAACHSGSECIPASVFIDIYNQVFENLKPIDLDFLFNRGEEIYNNKKERKRRNEK